MTHIFRHRTAPFICLLCAVAALSSCRHRDFCEDHLDHAPTPMLTLLAHYARLWEIPASADMPYADWAAAWPASLPMAYADQTPGIPEGLRVIFFPEGDAPYTANLGPYGGDIQANRQGAHALLLYNNDTECILFDSLDSFSTSHATTRTRSRASYRGNPYHAPAKGGRSAERTVNPPDMIYGAFIPSIDIAPTLKADRPLVDVEMRPLVFTYVIEHAIDAGAEYITSARGALAGMAEGVWLGSGTATDEAVTLLYDCQPGPASVTAVVRSFGTPSHTSPEYGSRAPGRFALNLELCLKNGKVLSYDFDVTDQIAAQPRGGVVRVGGINIKEEDATTYGSGFEVDVTDWGDTETLPMY